MKAHKSFLALRGAGRGEMRLRRGLFILCQGFSLASLVYFIGSGQADRSLLCAVTPLLLCLPAAAERLLGKRMNTAVYLFCLLYAVGPMLGHSHKLYYMIPWWDKLLHTFGGLVFALVGSQFPALLGGEQNSFALCALFAFCFSVAVAALWEFFEYGMDHFFAMDMQGDSIVTALHSYDLGAEMGVLGHIGPIQSVTVNGQSLPGYLDIGLHDSMWDMMLETLGAMVLSLWLWLDKGRTALFIPRKTEETVRC